MQNKQFIAVGVSIAVVFLLLGQQILPKDFSSLFTSSTLRALTIELPASSGFFGHSESRDEAWSTWQEYLEFARAHDLVGVMSLSHQISPTCSDPSQRLACEALMDNIYALGSTLKKEDFTNVWSDDKQIILATDYETSVEESFNLILHTRTILYFTKDPSGQILILGFNPSDGVALQGRDLDDETIKAHLDSLTLDSDRDGLSDAIEVCSQENFDQGVDCEETDPYDPDTNGNGWWDGIEALFR